MHEDGSSSDSSDDAIIQAVLAMVSSGSDDEEDGAREQVPPMDMLGWRHLSNASFKENFRMDRTVFEKLIGVFGQHMVNTNRLIRNRTPLDMCLLMGLWPIFNPDTFRSSGEHFGKKKAVIHYHYSYVIEIFREMSSRFIKWPDAAEREAIKAHFERVYGMPGVVGAIDGVHVPISAPLFEPRDYIDRHHNYSILVQAVCDHNLLYRDVYCGEPGAVGDRRNYKRSPLSKILLTRPDYLSPDEHIIGDGAYQCTDKIQCPYVDDGNLTPVQRLYNYTLSSGRSSIERSYGLLKGKDRRLKYLPMRNPELVVDHIITCFVIHNFIILEGNDSRGLPPADVMPIPEEDFERLSNESVNRGIMKREYIAHVLYGE